MEMDLESTSEGNQSEQLDNRKEENTEFSGLADNVLY
jgi:hypothetical protein